MVPSVFSKYVARAKRARKAPLKPGAAWVRLSLEALDQRILPSVTAKVNDGILDITADQDKGTTGVQILLNNSQIEVNDVGHQQVGSFGVDTLQAIHFHYGQREMDLAVDQAQIKLTDFPLTEADFTLGTNALTAGATILLPNQGSVNFAGTVNDDSTFDLNATANVQVANFPLNANFDLTNTSMAVASQATLPVLGPVDLAGSLTSDGQYSLAASNLSFTAAGFTVANASAALDNTGLAVSGQTSIPGVTTVDLAGSVDTSGDYYLQGSANVTVDGFPLNNATFTLANNVMSVAAGLSVPGIGTVNMDGSVDNQGQFTLNGTSHITVDGFGLDASFTLTNTSLSVAAALTLTGVGEIDLNGTVDDQGQFNLAGTANITLAGFGLDANFTLTNTELDAAAGVDIPGVGTVNLAGTVDDQGQFSLTGTGHVTIAGFAIDSSFTLTNTELDAAAGVDIPGVGTVNLSGTVDNQGQFNLTGMGHVTLAGFTIDPSFTLTNTELDAAANVAIPGIGTIDVAGSVDNQGQFTLDGSSHITVGGFDLDASFELTNTSLSVAAALTLAGVGEIDLNGTVDNQGQFNLAGTANITLAGFGLDANFTLTNTSLAVAAGLDIPNVGTVNLAGSVDNQGHFTLTGSGHVTIAGFTIDPSFTLTNTSLTAAAGVVIPGVGTVNLSGTVDNQGNFSLTGSGHVTIAGFAIDPTFTLTNTDLTVAANVAIPGVGTVNLSGTVDNQGQFNLTGMGHVTLAGFTIDPSFTLTNTELDAAVSINVTGVGSIDLSGTVDNQGHFTLDGSSHITVAGFGFDASFELTNTSLTVAATITIPGIGDLDFSGTLDNQGHYSLTAMGHITVGGFAIDPTFTLTNTNLTVAAAVTIPGVGNLNFAGTVDNQGHYSLTAMAHITVGGFAIDPTFTLTNTNLTVAASLTIPGAGNLNFSGTVDNQGHFSLTAMAHITVAGFTIDPTFTLTNTTLTVAAGVTIPGVGNLNFAGTVDNQGHYSLTAMAHVTIAGFTIDPRFTLTNTTLTVAASLTIPGAGNLNFAGTIDNQGHFSLMAMAHIMVAGFAIDPTFTLTNTTLTVAAGVTIPGVGNLNFSGTVDNQGHYSLTAMAHIMVAGFAIDPRFTLTNTTLTVAASLTIPGAGNLNFSGTIDNQGHFSLTAMAHITVGGFAIDPTFTLTNTTLTVAAGVTIPGVGNLNFTGTVDNQGHYSLTAMGHVTIAGFTIDPRFTLTNTTLTVAASLTIPGAGNLNFAGMIDNQGHFSLTAMAHITVAGFVIDPTFTLTNTTLTVAAGLNIPGVGNLNFSGTVDRQGNYSLTAMGRITVAGFAIDPTFTLTNTTLTVAAVVTIPVIGSLNFRGTVDRQGNYSLTAGAHITVNGFAIDPTFTLTNTNLTVAAVVSIPGVGNLNFTGTVDRQGNYSLMAGAHIMVGGFAIDPTFTLTNTTLTLAATVAVPGVGNLNFSGTVDRQGHYSLTAGAHIMVGGFTIDPTFTLTNTMLTVAAVVTIPGVGNLNFSGTVDRQGNYSLTAGAHITVGGFVIDPTFTLTNTMLTVAAVVNIPGVGNLNFSGTVDRQGNYTLMAGAHITVGGFAIDPTFTLTNTTLTLAATVTIPSVGNLHFSGTVDRQGHYSLSAGTHITVGGFGLDATFTLTNTNLTVSAMVNLPVVGTVTLSGTIDRQGHYSLTASVADINILFVHLTSASVTLTNTDLTVAAHATGIPLLGAVDFTGRIAGSSYSFTATVPSVNILGFTLRNLFVTLTNNSLTVGAHAMGLPIVGDVDFTGQITSSGFSLSATKANVDLLGFIHFGSVSLTLTSASLSLSAATHLPIVGDVIFAGTLNFSGSFTISATAPHFQLLGFIDINNASVAISFPNPTLTVSAHVSLLNIGMVDFTGSIGAGGRYSFSGSASLVVAGFTLGRASMRVGSDPADQMNGGIHIGPFTTPALPVVGPVTLEGSYGPRPGQFSFDVDVRPTPPIMLGPIPVDRLHLGLSNDSLTLGVGVGYNIAGALAIEGYAQVTVHTNGDFRLLATVNASVLGFQAANGQLELLKTGGNFTMTLDANINLIIAHANFHGFIDFVHGKFDFRAEADIGIAGFTLSHSSFVATNIPDPVHYPGVDLRIEVHSHTNLHLQPVISADVDFDGVLLKSGSSYTISVHGKTDLTIAGFNLARATLDLDNTHMAVSVHYAYPGIFSADFSGSVSFNGNFDLRARATVGLSGFGAVADLHLFKQGSNAGLDISANINVYVAQVSFAGSLHSNGQFSLTGSARVGFAGFSLVTASFTLNNSGATVAADVNVVVATVHFSGSIRSNGQFSLAGSARVGFAGFALATGAFTLDNNGVSVIADVNVFVATVHFSGSIRSNGQFSLTGSARIGLAGFSLATVSFTLQNGGVSVAADINVVVATVHFSGSIHSNGQFSLTGSASIRLLVFNASASFTLNNSGVFIHANMSLPAIGGINLDGYVRSNGQFSLTFNGHFGILGFGVGGSVTLNNSGISVNARLDVGILGFHMNFAGAINTNGSFRFAVSTGLHFGPLSAGLDLTFANTGFSAHVHAAVDLTTNIGFSFWHITVGVRGSVDVGFGINTNGTFNANGSIHLDAYLGIHIGFGIGFHVNNHQFCVDTHNIGFSIWGIGFHPFGDLCVNY